MQISLKIKNQVMTAECDGPIVAGSVGVVTCAAEFDEGWSGNLIRIVFEGSGVQKEHEWDGKEFDVPWEVLRHPGSLMISAVGEGPGVIRPTARIWYPLKVIRAGDTDVQEPEGSPKSLVFQAREYARMAQGSAEEAAQTVERMKEESLQTVNNRLAQINEVEDQIVLNEKARIQNEASRSTAESERARAEALRAEAETGRATSESLRQTAEADRAAAETERSTAEETRGRSESAREQAESNRNNAETARANTEGERRTAETNRATAETSRGKAERDRASAESARESAEGARKKAEKARADADAERQRVVDQFVARQIAPPVSWMGEAVTVNAPTLAMLGG